MAEIFRVKDALSAFQKSYIEENVTKYGAIPLYMHENSCQNDGFPKLTHNLIDRITSERDPSQNDPLELRTRSDHAFIFVDILKSLLEANGESIDDFEIMRMVINVSFRTNDEENKHGKMHRDHDSPYRQVIMTLNDNFTGGGTYVKVSGDSVILPSEKYTAYMFDDQEHCAILPNTGLRMVWVATCRKVK